MQTKAIDGTLFEIDMGEARRIHNEVAKHMGGAMAHRETPEHYHDRAFRNICKRAEAHGIRDVKDEEGDVKDLLLLGIDLDDADLVGEAIEWFVSTYHMKVGA